jgi:cytochrome c-type biogenesis protein CcmH
VILEFLLALLTTATVAVLLVPLLRTRPAAPTARLDNDLAIYRDQLSEIGRERAQGLVSDAEAQQATTEIQRRILAAADQADAQKEEVHRAESVGVDSPSGVRRFLPPALCLLIPLFALGVYLQIGRPGLPASPFASHRLAPADPEARPDFPALLADARQRATENPEDPDAAASLGELLVLEANGTVTGPALEAFTQALKLKPDDPRASYYLGLHEAQAGDSKAALARWQALAARAPADAPWLRLLNDEITRVAKEAGLPVPELRRPPPATPATPPQRGPTQEQAEAMARLSPEERQQAIRGMVEGLAARLKAGPGDRPEDRDAWLRLANARKVLGQADLSAEAYAKADALQPLDARQLADWAEALVRQVPPGSAPPPQAVAVLKRLEEAEPRNALALFYLGAADFAAGNKPEAARRWKTLLQLLPVNAPIRGMLEAKIKEAGG